MPKAPTHARKGMTITDLETKQVEKFNSINAAKRRSRELQKKHGAVMRLDK